MTYIQIIIKNNKFSMKLINNYNIESKDNWFYKYTYQNIGI